MRTPRTLSIHMQEEIRNDGSLSDPVWSLCPPVDLGTYDGSAAPEALRTSVRSCWTDGFIYFGFRGCFSSLRMAPRELRADEKTGKTFRLWELSDVFELFIDPSAKETKIYREFQVSPDSRWIDIAIDASGEVRRTDFGWVSGMIARSTVDYENKRWESIMQIPQGAFSEKARKGSVWNANFYRISGPPDACSYLAWAPVHRIDFHQPELFGDLLFTSV